MRPARRSATGSSAPTRPIPRRAASRSSRRSPARSSASAWATVSRHSCRAARRRSRSSKSTSPGATERQRRLAQGVAELACEHLDGAARAARKLELPLALGLEAAVAEAFPPRLDRLADAVEIEGLALELLGPRHHVGRGADERAEGGPGLDRVLAPRPRRRKGRGEGFHVVQEEALGVLPQLLNARAAPELLHRLEQIDDLLGQRRLAHATAAGAEHLDLTV